MRRLKYGERTITMRIPLGLVPKVRELLAQFEPLDMEKPAAPRRSGGSSKCSAGRGLTFDTPQERAELEQAFSQGIVYGAGMYAGSMLRKVLDSGRDISQSKALMLSNKIAGTDAESALLWQRGVQEGLENWV